MPTCQECGNSFPNRTTINGKRHVLSSRKYCLDCSPFGEHRTYPINHVSRHGEKMTCRVCDRDFEYDHSKGHQINRCNSCTVTAKRAQTQDALIELLGGMCVADNCGYDAHRKGLSFHHRDKETKLFGLSGAYSMSQETVDEAAKCDLLCVRCHAEVEAGYRVDKFPYRIA